MSIEKAHSRKVVKSIHATSFQKESVGKPLKQEKQSGNDHIVNDPLEQTKDILQKEVTKLPLSYKSIDWIMFLIIAILLINLTADWKSMMNMILEIAFVVFLLTTVFLFSLVGKDKKVIAELEKKIDKMQEKIDIISRESNKSEAQHAMKVKKLLDKLKKKEQEEIEMMKSIEVLSAELKDLRADAGEKSSVCSLNEESNKKSPKRVSKTEALAELCVVPRNETQDLCRSKIMLAENASVLIEDLRKGLRELESPKK